MKRVQTPPLYVNTVKLGNKEWLNKEQLRNREPFSVTNIQVYLINSEQFCDDQKVPYYHVRPYKKRTKSSRYKYFSFDMHLDCCFGN